MIDFNKETLTREEVQNYTELELRQWIYRTESITTFIPPKDKTEYNKFIKRCNLVYFDYGLSRMGIDLTPITCGELTLNI